MSCPDLKAYLLGELTQQDQQDARQHTQACASCRMEMERLQVTLAALRKLPDEEIPVHIRFVSDKVFEDSGWRRWFVAGSPARFAAALMVPALLVSGAFVGSRWHAAPAGNITEAQIQERVQKAVEARMEAESNRTDTKIHEAVARAVADVDRRNEIRTRTMLADFQSRARVDREGLVRAVESEYRWVDQKLNQVVYSANEKIPVMAQ